MKLYERFGTKQKGGESVKAGYTWLGTIVHAGCRWYEYSVRWWDISENEM